MLDISKTNPDYRIIREYQSSKTSIDIYLVEKNSKANFSLAIAKEGNLFTTMWIKIDPSFIIEIFEDRFRQPTVKYTFLKEISNLDKLQQVEGDWNFRYDAFPPSILEGRCTIQKIV